MYPLIPITLLALLLIAAWKDIRYYRIPNALFFSGTLIGLLLNTLLPQEMGGLGILPSLTGLSIGLIVLLPLYLLRAMGAGDIKLMAMIGTFVGPSSILIVTLYVFLAGGALAFAVILLKGKLSRLLDNFRIMLMLRLAGSSTPSRFSTETLPKSVGKLPYGVAIAAGTFAYLVTIH